MEISKDVLVTMHLPPDETVSVKVQAWQVDAFRIEWNIAADHALVYGMQLGYVRSGNVSLNKLPTAITELLREEAKK